MQSARHAQVAEKKEGEHQQSRSMLSKMPSISGLGTLTLGQNGNEWLPKKE